MFILGACQGTQNLGCLIKSLSRLESCDCASRPAHVTGLSRRHCGRLCTFEWWKEKSGRQAMMFDLNAPDRNWQLRPERLDLAPLPAGAKKTLEPGTTGREVRGGMPGGGTLMSPLSAPIMMKPGKS